MVIIKLPPLILFNTIECYSNIDENREKFYFGPQIVNFFQLSIISFENWHLGILIYELGKIFTFCNWNWGPIISHKNDEKRTL